MIKITSGKYRSRNIYVPDNLLVPTKSMVREAIGNMTREYISNATCLDLFAGSGAVGIEFLSNSASFCDFVEKDPNCHKAIKDNLESLKEKNGKVHFIDSLEFLEKTNLRYDLIFIDPPYAYHEAYQKALFIIKERSLLKENGRIILEYEGDKPPFDNPSYSYSKEKRYGKTRLMVAKSK